MAINKHSWPVLFITITRGFTVGLAFYLVVDIPGLTSSFVAIFVALLPFDLIVAMPRFSLRLQHWRELFSIVLPRISGTAITLGQGIALGALFGVLTLLGLPVFLGAVFIIGIAYQVSIGIKGNISSYVGMLAGISVFDQIIRLPVISGTLLSDVAGTGLRVFYGTFTALFAGWVCGVGVGIITRLFLPRGFRMKTSDAYEQPLTLQPFRDVLHADENMVLIKATVDRKSPLAHRLLADSNLRSQYQVSVLSIFRQPKDVVAPRGTDMIYAGDVLVLLMPSESVNVVMDLMKGSGMVEPV